MFRPPPCEAQRRFYDDLGTGKARKGLWGLERRFSPQVAVDSESFRTWFTARIAPHLRPDMRVLDVGCGTGMYFPLLAPLCGSLTGVELSAGYARLSRQNARDFGLDNVRMTIQDAARLGLRDACFDAAVCVDALHHVPDLERTLAELARVVRPGGPVLVFEPNCLNPLLLALCVVDRNERGAVSRCWKGAYEAAFARSFRLRHSEYNGLLIGPQGRAASALVRFLMEGPAPGLLGRLAPKLFFHLEVPG